jgi:hypothetical protein
MKWMRRKQVRLNKNGKETHAWVEGGEVSSYEMRCFHLYIPKQKKKTRLKQGKDVRSRQHELERRGVIQMDIGGHPPFPTGSKQFSDILAIYYF